MCAPSRREYVISHFPNNGASQKHADHETALPRVTLYRFQGDTIKFDTLNYKLETLASFILKIATSAILRTLVPSRIDSPAAERHRTAIRNHNSNRLCIPEPAQVKRTKHDHLQ